MQQLVKETQKNNYILVLTNIVQNMTKKLPKNSHKLTNKHNNDKRKKNHNNKKYNNNKKVKC